ncbi:MAG: hypothetical protein H8E85_06615 [Candidatus Marinimicrobia bacterium]|nr:hypothetical protein [Candidatus Neomarinimicrobiota bacterium]
MDEIKLMKKELIEKNANFLNNTYISLGAGFLTKKLWNFGQFSIDVGVNNNLSIFIGAGYPTLIGGGLSILQNRNSNGLTFSAGLGFEPDWEALDILSSFGYQWRLGKSPAFLTVGASIGIWDFGYYDYFNILPVIDLDVRF